jgi:threonine/homoserine/homoserine lactone efflux protein
VATIITVIPGVDMALIARSVLAHGRRAGYVTSVGVSTGLWVHAVASALGLSSILMASATLLLPQFIRPGDSVLARSLLLAGVHVVIGLVWLILYAYFLGRLSPVLRRPRVRRALEGVTGTLLLAIGGRLAWDRR